MTDPVRWQIQPGVEVGGVVAAVYGDLVAIRVKGPQGTPVVVPVQVGALEVRPGYAGAWTRRIASRLDIGDSVRVTWIAAPADGMPVAMIEDRSGSLDASAIADGWALPAAHGASLDGVRQAYRTAVEYAARNRAGSWNDVDEMPSMFQGAKALYGDHIRLAPSFVAAYPGISMMIVAIILGGLLWTMRRENDDLAEKTKESGPIGKAGAWFINIHTRFIPRTRFKGREGPPHA